MRAENFGEAPGSGETGQVNDPSSFRFDCSSYVGDHFVAEIYVENRDVVLRRIREYAAVVHVCGFADHYASEIFQQPGE
jgi:hypothetical protein